MSTLLRFEAGAVTLQFIAGGDYPAKRSTSLLQVQDRSAGGKLHTETLGVSYTQREIAFNLMPEADYLGLLDFFINVVNGGELPFYFTDEYGYRAEAVFRDSTIQFTETSLKLYSGKIVLEYV